MSYDMVARAKPDPLQHRPQSRGRPNHAIVEQVHVRQATAHIGLNQPVDHESGRHVDTVLTGIFAVPLHLSIKVGIAQAAAAPGRRSGVPSVDDVDIGRGVKVRIRRTGC